MDVLNEQIYTWLDEYNLGVENFIENELYRPKRLN